MHTGSKSQECKLLDDRAFGLGSWVLALCFVLRVRISRLASSPMITSVSLSRALSHVSRLPSFVP